MDRKILWATGLAVAACAACSKGSNLTVSALSGAAPAAASAPATSGDVTVKTIRIVIRKVALDRADGEEVTLPPMIVSVAGSSPIEQVYQGTVPAGDYTGLRFVVGRLAAAKSAADPGLAAMASLHASIAVDGDVAGTSPGSFEFTTPMEVAQARSGKFTIGQDQSGASNVTFKVDPSGWFVGQGGSTLDPRDPTNRGEILANIRKSIRLFPDTGERGEDADDCECHDEPPAAPASTAATSSGGDEDPGEDGHHDVACTCTPKSPAPATTTPGAG